jgi:cysteine-rich repeat protein
VGMCVAASCGDGFLQANVEACDDGNMVDGDSCSSDCMVALVPLGTILLGGSANAEIVTALNTIGEPYMTDAAQWLPPDAADILIMANDGGSEGDGPDYTAHLDSGKHVLIIGGSGDQVYANEIGLYFAVNGQALWHQSDDCVNDWVTGNAHPMTALLPATYEFADQAVSYHMLHFVNAGQPGGVTLLGSTCHQAPDNHVLATRAYQNGGSMTYMALDLGQYGDMLSQPDFLVPFLQGYFNWIQLGTP